MSGSDDVTETRDDQIQSLLDEVLESSRTPEEVCANRPDLLAEVQARLRKLKAVEAQLNALFPRTVAADPTHDATLPRGETPLPSIPGYEVLAELGRGGMGIVYWARHLKLNREVAVKMLLTGPYASQQEHLRFVREAESVAALHHPNIVQIYEFGEVEGRPFYTMEFVPGGSLADKLLGGLRSPREAAETTAALARAMQAAHRAEIVHRDLKPANILLDAQGAPKIADFGLARRLDQDSGLTNTGARIGTPSYMAPEQMAGNPALLGPAVDVFALGALLFELLTGRPPFRGDTLSDTERRLASEDPASPSQLNPKVPRDLETICLKCLEKEPERRFLSAGELADDLERFLRHEPIHARPIAPAERWARWVRRNPLLTALAAMSIALIGLISFELLQERYSAAAASAERTRLTSRFDSGVQLVKEERYAEARAILEKLGDGGFEDLRARIDRAVRDLDLVEKLEQIGVKRAMTLLEPDETWSRNKFASEQYQAQFAQAEIGQPSDDPAGVARRITASDIEQPLISALDDWAVCEPDAKRRDWVLQVARLASGGGTFWEKSYRDPQRWSDPEHLRRLAEPVGTASPSVTQLRALGDRLAAAGLDASDFRFRVQQEHVDSFLANLMLADTLCATDPAEAVRYYQAALAIRPRSATAHNNLAVALAKLGRSEEALRELDVALALDKTSPAIRRNLETRAKTTSLDSGTASPPGP